MSSCGISLGWNCEAASRSVELKIRDIKSNGYTTCPFDECLSNYDGVILCIQEDFKYFCDPSYLKLMPARISTGGLKEGEILLVNTRYKFIFNHESPGHANLYLIQNWAGGINHYIADNYKLFIERYNNRIENFRNYLKNNEVNFIIVKNTNDTSKLKETISEKYPELKFDITSLYPHVPNDLYDNHHMLMNEIE
jgi:hypothetical protein